MQKGSVILEMLKKYAKLIKEGLFWICNRGFEALFQFDSWDGFSPIMSRYPNLQDLCQCFLDIGWSQVVDFKTCYLCGHVEVFRWKVPSA